MCCISCIRTYRDKKKAHTIKCGRKQQHEKWESKMRNIEKHCESFWETLRWLKNSTNQEKLPFSFSHFWRPIVSFTFSMFFLSFFDLSAKNLCAILKWYITHAEKHTRTHKQSCYFQSYIKYSFENWTIFSLLLFTKTSLDTFGRFRNEKKDKEKSTISLIF